MANDGSLGRRHDVVLDHRCVGYYWQRENPTFRKADNHRSQGQYKMELAPGLNLVQHFIEAIAKQISQYEDIKLNGSEILFRIRDKNVISRKKPYYLLGVSLQNGYLFFEARQAPQESIHLNTMPIESDSKLTVMEDMEIAIHTVAKLWSIDFYRVK